MRRVPASLLLVLFSFSLFGPGVFAGAEARLPACCRRTGAHRCAMQQGRENRDPGVRVDAARSRCPYLACGPAVSGDRHAALAVSGPSAPFAPLAQGRLASAAEGWYRRQFSRGDQKRGPPDFRS